MIRPNVITATDFDRLSGIVHSGKIRASHGPLASQLKHELGRGSVVPPTNVPRDVVTMNSTVRIRDTKTGESETYTLAYPHEANIDENRLSVLAPLGMALLGAKAGESVEVKTPGGIRRLKVEQILYQPEAAGDLHL